MQIWERRRRIPSTIYNDPLLKMFNEFDADGDGHLTAQEIADALLCVLSRSVVSCPPIGYCNRKSDDVVTPSRSRT